MGGLAWLGSHEAAAAAAGVPQRWMSTREGQGEPARFCATTQRSPHSSADIVAKFLAFVSVLWVHSSSTTSTSHHQQKQHFSSAVDAVVLCCVEGGQPTTDIAEDCVFLVMVINKYFLRYSFLVFGSFRYQQSYRME